MSAIKSNCRVGWRLFASFLNILPLKVRQYFNKIIKEITCIYVLPSTMHAKVYYF